MPEIRLIDANGEQVGIVKREEALERAVEAGLDLVESRYVVDDLLKLLTVRVPA